MRKRELLPEYQRFSAVLKKIRQERGINQVEIAKRLKKPQSYISKIESGERRLDFVELRVLCHVMGISVADFARTFEEFSNRDL